MGKKLTTSDFVKRAREVHGDKYNYSKANYMGTHKMVCIICPEHGEFRQTPNSHLNGNGCPKCGRESTQKYHTSTTKEFVNKAREVHGDKYDYSKVEYVNNRTKVCIICPKHGEFWQTPKSHLKGNGCPNCGGVGKLNTTKFINRARKIHVGKYDYSKVKYVNTETKVCIICPEHGEFWQTPHSHLRGQGCPKCYGNINLSTSEFIKKAREVHGNKYDYSKVKYVNNNTKVCIICPEHGEFWQVPSSHLNWHGCPNCQGVTKQYKFNLFQEFKNEKEFRDFLDANDIDTLYIMLQNMEAKYDPIKKDIEKALKNIKSKDPIKALEEKYSKEEDNDIDDSSTNNKDYDLDNDNMVDDIIGTQKNEKDENTNKELTIEEAVKNLENRIKVVSKISPMLAPEVRKYIKAKYLNEKMRLWMAKREASKQ